MSADDVKALGVSLKDLNDRGRWGKSFEAVGLTRVLTDTETVVLSFGHRNQLFRVVAAAKSSGPDPYGAATLARYAELSESLTARYGRGTETDFRDTELWKAPNEYVMSLKQGRARRYTNFSKQGVVVELSMRADSTDTSFNIIFFESVSGSADFVVDKKRLEREAL